MPWMRPLVVEPDLVVDAEVVALAGHDHVVVAVEPELRRPPVLTGDQRGDDAPIAPPASPCRRSRRPCAAPRPSRRCSAGRARGRSGAAPRSDAGSSNGRARRRPPSAWRARPGPRDRNDPVRRSSMPALEAMRRRLECAAPHRRGASHAARARSSASPAPPRCVRIGGQVLVLDGGQLRRRARAASMALGGDGEQHLAGELDLVGREDRIVACRSG